MAAACCAALATPAFALDCEAPAVDDSEIANAEIGAVVLDRRQIFDTSLPEEDKLLYRLANRYHVLTRESTIRSALLFRPGERYDARVAQESERLLRSRSYFYEAVVKPVNLHPGKVDICVTTRDVWTLRPDLSFSRAGGENELSIEIEDMNLLGTGAAMGFSYGSDSERDSRRLMFGDPQLGRTRIALALELANNSDGHRRRLDIERPFFALDARWSASLRLLDDERISPLYRLGRKVVEFDHHRQHLQLAGGWSRGLVDGWVRRLSAGLVVEDSDFSGPPDPALAGPVPADRKLAYPFVALELLEDNYVETTNQDQIGRTEDLHLGTRFTASLGYAATGFGADREAFVFTSGWRDAFGRPERDLLVLDAQLSGRYADDAARNTVFQARARYYHRLSERRLLFATLSGATGKRLDLDNPIVLGGDSGLRGYPLAYQNGTSRVLATIEQRYFTDWYPLRLARVGGAIFADLGRTWGRNPVGGTSSGWLRDVGIGLRLASTRSGSGKILHIDLAFPLDGDASIDDVQLLIEGRRGF